MPSVGAIPPNLAKKRNLFHMNFPIISGCPEKKKRAGSQVKRPSLRRPHVATVMNGPWMSSPSDPGGSTCTGWSNPIWTYGWFNGDPYPALKFNGVPSEKWWGGWFRRSGFLLGLFCNFTAGLSQFFTSGGEISNWMIFSRGVISYGPFGKLQWGGGCVTVSGLFFQER